MLSRQARHTNEGKSLTPPSPPLRRRHSPQWRARALMPAHVPSPRSWLDAPDCVRVYSRPNCSTVRALVDDWCGKVYKLSRFRGHNHSRDAAVWRAAMLPLCRYIAYDEHQGSPVANGSVMQT